MHVDHTILVALLGAAGLAFVDWILGALVALKAGTFGLSELDRQLVTTILPKLGGLAILAVLQQASETQWGDALGTVGGVGFGAAAAAYTAATLTSVLTKVGGLTGSPAQARKVTKASK